MATRSGQQLPEEVLNYLDDRYIHIREFISTGGFSSVFKAVKNGQTVALKLIDLKKPKVIESQEFIENECEIVLKVNHQFIIQTHSVLRINDSFIVIISDFADGGDLITIIDKDIPIEEHLIQRWFSQTVKAVEYLHKRGIAHRDIKPDNILIKKGIAKLTDFGYSKKSVNSKGKVIKTRDSCGTLEYLSPEQIVCLLDDEPFDPFVSEHYSLGVLLFLLVELDFPYQIKGGWNNRSALETALRHQLNENWSLNGEYRMKVNVNKLLEQLLQPDVSKRITYVQVLNNPWIKNFWK